MLETGDAEDRELSGAGKVVVELRGIGNQAADVDDRRTKLLTAKVYIADVNECIQAVQPPGAIAVERKEEIIAFK